MQPPENKGGISVSYGVSYAEPENARLFAGKPLGTKAESAFPTVFPADREFLRKMAKKAGQPVENKGGISVSYAWPKNEGKNSPESGAAVESVGNANVLQTNNKSNHVSYVSYVSYAVSYARDIPVGNVGNTFRFPTFPTPPRRTVFHGKARQ